MYITKKAIVGLYFVLFIFISMVIIALSIVEFVLGLFLPLPNFGNISGKITLWQDCHWDILGDAWKFVT